MTYNITDPSSIFSPRDKITDVIELYRSDPAGGFSIARVIWDGNVQFGIRWNVSMREEANPAKQGLNGIQSKGNPVSRGYPTWFILPDGLICPTSTIGEKVLENLAKVEKGEVLEKKDFIEGYDNPENT